VIFWVYVHREESVTYFFFLPLSKAPNKLKDLKGVLSKFLTMNILRSSIEIPVVKILVGNSFGEVETVRYQCNITDYIRPLQLLMHLQNSTYII
jgi:hypothetical protein